MIDKRDGKKNKKEHLDLIVGISLSFDTSNMFKGQFSRNYHTFMMWKGIGKNGTLSWKIKNKPSLEGYGSIRI